MNTTAIKTRIANEIEFRTQIWGYLELPVVKASAEKTAEVHAQLDANEAEINRLKAELAAA